MHCAIGSRNIELVRTLLDAGADLESLGDEGVTPVMVAADLRSEEHTSELQSHVRISYAVFCLKKKIKK